jgi:hypothetical protein
MRRVRPSRCGIGAIALVVGAVLCAAPADGPSSRPADRAQAVRAWLAGLGDAAEAVREDSRQQLLGLSREELGLLRKAAGQAVPLEASQAAMLREIVTHVYLTGQKYVPDPSGFLGVVLARDEEEAGGVPNPQAKSSVIVESRLPGFCSYRMLQDGDMILEAGGAAMAGKADLINAIRACRPGDTVALKVLRQGKTLKVTIVLDARPADAVGLGAAGQIEAMRNARQDEADKYWEATFAPLLRPERAEPGG